MTRFHRFLWLIVIVSILVSADAGVVRAQQYSESTYQEMRWRMIGPFRGGRTRAATGVPSQPNVFYIGAVNGGVWKSDDYGRTWMPIFDAQPTQSIGAIAMSPSDPNIIYVGCGEGLQRPDLSVGDGIYKSTDAGKTWTHLDLRNAQSIPTIVIDPRDSNRLFAAVLGHPYGPNEERGIFRSTNGGQTWEKVLYKDENTGGSDVVMDPSNPDVLFASLWKVRGAPWENPHLYNGTGGGLFKSTDGGSTWHSVSNGFPDDLTQIYVRFAPSQPSRMYASVATTKPSSYRSGSGLAFYRSDDAGANWYQVTNDPRPVMRIGGGDLPVPMVDPQNADIVYSTSIVTMRSTDGGKSWTGIRGAPGGDDYQNIWINPNNPNIILLVGDQGALVSVNKGQTWSSWYNQPTAQMYHVGTDNRFAYHVCGGQQESGSVCISSRGNDGEITAQDWHPVGTIEYGYVAPDPLHPDIVYGAGKTEVSKFHWTTGEVQNITPIPLQGEKYRVVRTLPLLFSPVDPHILYYSSNVLFKTIDGGNSWQSISPDLGRPQSSIPTNVGTFADKDENTKNYRGVIYALGPSFKTVDTLWAGTDDGLIWITRDGGKNWKDITPPEMTPWSKVTQIVASHFDEQSAYASVSRFRIDDLRPYIYRTHDGGKTWKLITSGLPGNAPVDTVREDPVRKGLLFAGTETAVWVSFDDGDHWQSLQLNLPHTAMRDLLIHNDDLIVATHGRSFWILDDITPLREISESMASSGAYLFKPATAYRVRRDTNTDTPIPPDEPTGENPPDGAVIDYYLAHPVSSPVTLEILDATGKLVRRYGSTDAPDITQEEIEKQLIPAFWVRMPKNLSTDAGMHRWVWDVHYPAPVTSDHEYPISAIPHDTPRMPLGARALPGQYTVRLTVNGQTFRKPLIVKMDPRVEISQAGLEKLFNLETRLDSMLARSSEAMSEAGSVRDQLQKLSGQASNSVGEAVNAVEKKTLAVLGAPAPSAGKGSSQPTLSHLDTDVNTLYGEDEKADAAPTVAQLEATTRTERDLAAVLKLWNEIKATEIPSLNRQLRAANLPEIRIESNAHTDGDLHRNEE